MKQTHYVGTCPHDIPAEWYDRDESTYNVLDSNSGAYVVVTTCEPCKRENEKAGCIVEEVDMPMDDFYIPDAFIPKSAVIVNEAGEVETIELDGRNYLTDDEMNEALDN